MLTNFFRIPLYTGLAQLTHEFMKDYENDLLQGAAKTHAKIKLFAAQLLHCITAAYGIASICALKTYHFGYGSPSKSVLNPNAFNMPVFLGGIGVSVVLGLTNAILEAKDYTNKNSKTYGVIHFLHKAMPKLAKLANVVTMVALLYLSAPVLSAAGVGLLYHGASFLFDCLKPNEKRSLLPYIFDEYVAPRFS